MTGRESGANARPAITRTASSRRMAWFRFTDPISHRLEPIENFGSIRPALIRIKFLPAVWITYRSERLITAISSDIFWR
jgi:hypothetical protein